MRFSGVNVCAHLKIETFVTRTIFQTKSCLPFVMVHWFFLNINILIFFMCVNFQFLPPQDSDDGDVDIENVEWPSKDYRKVGKLGKVCLCT